MAVIGFHASHEQSRPSELLDAVQRAAAAGFAAVMCSDHFHPWSERQGQSGFAWAWLGAALQATGLPCGVVCAPGQRYHPAIIAQAAATLAEMFPGRFWLAVGSGEALNEQITGAVWPRKSERNARLQEAAVVMRALWAGETVNHSGAFAVRDATLYTRPPVPPPLYGAALSPETAEWMGGWADGLITAGCSADRLRRIIDAFRRGGGEGKPVLLQAALSYADSEEEAYTAAHHQWRHAVLSPQLLADLPTPQAFDDATQYVRPADLRDRLHIGADPDAHVRWLKEALTLGFDEIYLHPVGRDLRQFLDVFGERVLPRLVRA
jgi:coenzyme F420-dependent glucose-6-phosphate dehydrogenase